MTPDNKSIDEIARESSQKFIEGVRISSASINKHRDININLGYTIGFKAGYAAGSASKWQQERVHEVLEEDGGVWESCSGCHETVDGQETGHYPYSDIFKCYQGSGCRECGGIGVIYTDGELLRNYGNEPQPIKGQQGEGVEAIDILKELCQLKKHKDEVGKDSFYEKRQPELWAKANAFLNSKPTG